MEILPVKLARQNWEPLTKTSNTQIDTVTPNSPQIEVTQSVRIGGKKLEMSQSMLILGKEELIKLSQISDFYLLDELRTRGWEINGKELTEPNYSLEQLALLVYTTLKKTKMFLHHFIDLIIKTSIDIEDTHKDAAKVLGISPRVMCYQLRRIKTPKATRLLSSFIGEKN
jgi:hypothetical protein